MGNQSSVSRDKSNYKKPPRFFYGWVIVASAFTSGLLFYGIGTVAFGIFFRFMSEGLGWSRGLLASALLVERGTAFVLSPILGPLVDKYGPRWVMMGGTIALGLGALLMGAVNSPWQFFVAYGGIMTVGVVALGSISSQTAVAKWFVRKRGRALAIATMGLSGAGVIIPIPLAFLIQEFTWRGAWIAVALFVFVIGAGASLVMRRQPEDYGLLPDGEPPLVNQASQGISRTQQTVSLTTEEVNLTMREAARTAAFWLLIVSSNVAGMSLMGINIHLVSYLLDNEFSLSSAAGIVTFLYVLQTVAKPIWGLIAERLHVRYCIGICYVGGGIGSLLLLGVGSFWGIVIFALVYGLTRGAISLLTSLAWADYFGRRSLGGIRGISSVFNIVSGAGGPVLAGLLYDATGGYTLAFTIFAMSFWVGAVGIVLAKPPLGKQIAA